MILTGFDWSFHNYRQSLSWRPSFPYPIQKKKTTLMIPDYTFRSDYLTVESNFTVVKTSRPI